MDPGCVLLDQHLVWLAEAEKRNGWIKEGDFAKAHWHQSNYETL